MASDIKLTKIFCLLCLLVGASPGSAQIKGRTKGGSQSYPKNTAQSSQSSGGYYQREEASQNFAAAHEAPFQRQQVAESYAEQEPPFGQQQMSHNYGAPRGTSCSDRPRGPSNGSLRCQMTSEKNTCKGSCRAGYAFPDGSTIATVECFLRQGRWIPFKDFPSCTASYGGGGGGAHQHEILEPPYGGGNVQQQHEMHLGLGSSACERPNSPRSAQMSCRETRYDKQCQATCNPGYEFPDGTRQLSLSCNLQEGRWMPLPAFQDCRLHCYPECQNGGRCESNNVCVCPQEYRGNRCQYPVSYCDFSRLGSVMVVHNCFHTAEYTECRVSCPPGMTFDPPTASLYRCTVDGHWNPRVAPRCSNDMLCEQPPSPMNGRIQCSGNQNTLLCTAHCNTGYAFPEGFLELTIQCSRRSGEWSPMPNFPDCEPMCHPECQHGGRCLGHNRCLCPREYRGTTCQYSIATCDGHGRFSGVAWECQHDAHETVCQVHCGHTGLILEPPSPTEYVCSLDGTWQPSVKPRCVESSHYRGGYEREHEAQEEEEIGDFGSHTSDRDKQRGRFYPGQEEQETYHDTEIFGQQSVDEDEDNFEKIYGQNTIEQEVEETDFDKTDRLIDPRNEPKKPEPEEEPINEEENEIALFPESPAVTAQDTAETEEETELEEDKISGFSEPSENKGMCSVWGYHHYRTFDGLTFTFPGTCDYVLASDCGVGAVTIGIRHRCESPSSACDIAVEIHVPENQFFITPSAVLRNDEPSPIPVHVGTLTIEKISRYIVVKMTTGFIVWMDPYANVHITADNLLLRGKTCGLCGDNDGLPVNDAVSPDGQKLSSPVTFGNSWEMPDSEECVDASGHLSVCHSDTMEGRATVSAASLLCTSLLDPEYQECINLLDAEVYFRMCQMDCCSNPQEGCECDTFSQYFMECERQGGNLGKGWRRPAICPIQCSNGTVYQQCGPACPATCSNLQPTCPVENCVDGCHCPLGSVMEDGVCILLDQCPCRYGTRKYDSGEEMQQNCNTCSCVGGEWQCTDNICPATCSVSGPHFTTFDGLNYNLYSSCAHYLVKHRDFSIVVEMTSDCYNSPLTVCVKNVIIHTPEGAIVKMKPGMEVTVNGQEVPSLPVSAPGVYVTQATSVYMKAQMNNGLEVFWDGGASLHVTVPTELFRQLRGLCGTFSRSQTDDFLTPEGDTELTSSTFAAKWKVDDNCAESYDLLDAVEEEPCERTPKKRAVAVELCKVLNGPIFADCHSSVDQEPYYQSCLDDICRCEMQPELCLCESLANYAAACARKERIISWRREVPECGFHCPVGQMYAECADSCMYSCAVIAGSNDCQKSCVEGCACPQGQTLNEDQQCVSVSSCSCMHSGHMYPPDFLQRRGREMCECSYGQWNCRHATASDIILTPPPNVAIHCSDAKNEEFTDCLSECPVTCNNLHHHVPCTIAICSQGCRCKPGYVLDSQSNTCVLPHECPCHHGGRSYEDGEEVKMDCNTCMCEGGEWKCEDNPCPGLCHAWGESHYLTFDGKIYDFLGDCDYVLVRARAGEGEIYSVIIQNVPCGSGGTCSKSLIISLGEWSLTLTKENPLPPVPPESRLSLSQVGMFTLIDSDIGISIQWDQQTRVYVIAEPVWKGKLRGLCGDFNSDSSDDFRPPAGGMPLIRAPDFADTWRVHDYCSPSQHVTDTCESRPERRSWARHKCAVLKSELFQPCHSQVELEPYYSRCVYDACGCDKGGDCQCFCAAVATYAQECARQNVVIPWRSQELCPVQCEACDRYSPCISLCPPLTCDTLTENTEDHSCNHVPCVDGCEIKPCKPGFIYKALNNLTCVKEEECEEKPCAVINGISYREGERIRDDSVGDACQSCYCRNGEPDCIGVPCTSVAPLATVELLPDCELTGWTEWIDSIDPEDNDGNDVEDLQDLTLNHRIPCPLDHIRSIQCRVADTQAPSETTDQQVICDLENGLLCQHTEDEDCWNYEIRVYCDCVLEVTCPPEQEWHNCAFHCDLTCHSFEKELLPLGVCTEKQRCVPGCTNATCEFPYVARDADTCVTPEMCTCRLDSGYLLAPGEVVSSGCEKCQCLNNSLICSTLQECAPTTPVETTPATEVEVLRVTKKRKLALPAEECTEGWSIWVNQHYPDSLGETEFIEDSELYCPGGLITATECRDSELDQEYQLSGLTDIQCNLTGFYCLNSKQVAGRTCSDYKIRLYCDCVVTTPETTPTPVVSVVPPAVLPKTRPPIVPRVLFPTTISTTLACSYWSEWINNNKPRRGPASGEREDTLPFILQQTEGFCADGTITDIECRDVKRNRDYKDTKEVRLICDLHTGFLCKNGNQPDGRCLDYKIRYLCDCVTPTTPPVTTIVLGVTTPSFIFPCDNYRLIIDGSEPLSDAHLKASTTLSPKSGPQSSRLSSTYGLMSEGAWTARIADDSQFLEVNLGDDEAIFGVITKGRDDHNEWVTSYYILYSTDGITYSYYMSEDNMPKVFPGNFDSSSEVKHIFENPFEARVVRIQPLTWEGQVSLRWDLLGCVYEAEERAGVLPFLPTPTPTPSVEVCQDPMGLENGLISDSQLSASSSYDSSLSPTNGRLGSEIAWAAAILNEDQYLQVDFMEPRNIAGVVTKGREDVPQWVTSYNVAYSNDGVTWNNIVDDAGEVKDFPGNYDQDSVVTNMLPSIVRTRYLRIKPKSWKNWISMQVEILGCFHPYMCKDPMGIESGLVSNGQLSSSSAYDESLEAKNARLDSSSAWAAETLNPNEFLQVDFLETQNLTGVVTKGRPDVGHWVTAYEVEYSDDGDTWNKIEDDKGDVQEFMGNSDSDTAVTNLFSDTIRARYIRVEPTRWKGWISMRVEVLGCYHPQVCEEPMGLENGLLSDSQLSASSSYDNYLVPSSARLHENTGWVPAMSDEDQYLQVDFFEPRNVSAVVTKGRGDAPQWVTAYKVAHSDDGKEFEDVLDETGEPKEFNGNDDQDTPVINLLPETIETRFLRIKPVSWNDEIGVRLEVLGCYHPYTCREPMGVESNAISDFQITSSSNFDATLTPNDARLNSDSAWAAKVLDENQYLQVDFVTPQNITAVVTQGRNDAMQWVTEYVIAYSDDGESWTPLADEVSGRQKEFVANYDSDSPVTNTFPEEITTRFLRIQPTKWKDWISLRFEVLGCLHPPVCEMPMGLENGLMADSQITASSFKDSSVEPSEVRLSNEESAWVPDTLTDEFLQIDFLQPRNVSAVITKGRPDEEEWVSSYKIMHSDDGETWNVVEDESGNPLEFAGNSDQNTPVINPLPEILDTRYLRIVPTGWNDWIGLRAEILGCYHPYPEEMIVVPPEAVSVTPEEPWEAVLPLAFTPATPGLGPVCPNPNDQEISLLTDAFIATSSVAPGSKPSQINLNTRSSKGLSGGWVPKGNDLHPVVTVMFPEVKLVTGIVIQGREDADQWVKTFRVIVSEDGQSWQPLFDPNGKEEMNGTEDRNSIEGFYFREPVPAKIVKVIPETWNRRPSLRMDLRGCPHPLIETTAATTVVPPLVLCPEMEVELITGCPDFCPPGLVCDGKKCVDPVDCVCVHDGKIFMISDRIEDENCVQCDCVLGGHSRCSKKSCPVCEEDRKQIIHKNCTCDCEECADGLRLCPTSDECIPEERWCNGIVDCPDDEKNCITTLPLLPFVFTTRPPEIPENATCEILGRHINTFDGQEMNYDICNHIALQDIEDGGLTASLHKDCSSGNECQYSLKILHEDHDIRITSDLDVQFDGHQYTASQLVLLNKNPSLNITIEKVGEQIVVKSLTKSVTIIYDIRAHLKVGVSPEMMNNVVGLCGFYSGIETDDRRKPDGKQAITTKEFGDSWTVEGSPPCEPVICPVEMMTKALEICNQLREDPFTVCAEVVSVDTFVQFCMASTCECLKQGSKPEEKCKCDSFLPLVEACEKEIGVMPLRSWRFKHSCAPECPPGLTWDDCGPSCQLTCDHLTMEDCSTDCMSGCFCPPGTVNNGDVCIPPDHCSDKVCQGFGDPHLETYDGLFYNFQAEGTFLISSDSNLTFTIEAITEKCTRFVDISCVTGIQVIYNGHRVQMRKNRLVKIDQRSIPMDQLPVVSEGMIVLGFPGRSFVTLIPELSIEVRYYEENSGFAIKIPSKRYFNRTVGLCGNCNARLRDELENNPLSEFVCSWLTNGDEENCKDTFKEPDKGTGPVRICDRLEDEIFSSCHPLVDPDKYIKACSYDASHSGDEVGSFCKTAMEYARQCCQAGETINDWPQVLGCNVTCAEGLEYEQCHDACSQTCDSELDNSVNCRSLKVDGCFCPEGTILKNGKCAEAKSCETCDSEGHVAGDTWTDGPCKTCRCSETLTVDCTVEVCPANPVCGEDEVLTKNEPQEGSCCESFSCVTAPKECPDLEVPTCPEGQVAKIKKSEDYCPSFQCECDPLLCPPVVQPNPRDLEEGEVARLINDTCCPHVEVKCVPESCEEEPSCIAGLQLTEIPGKCCTVYKCKPPKDVCVYSHQYAVVNGYEVQKDPEDLTPTSYQPGESWKDGLCANCSCAEVQGQLIPRCVHEQCPNFENIIDNKDYELHEYNAKFKCCPDVFRMYCKDEAGNLYTEGEEWENPDDPCIKYLCETSFVGDVHKVKKVIDCPTCPQTSEYIPPSKKLGQCCGICTPTKCEEDGTLYSVGDDWVPASDQCQKAECVNVGGTPKIIYTNPSCPSIPDDCPRDKIMPDEKGCCNVCNVTSEIHCSTVPIPLEETVGLFSDYDVYYGGKCVNDKPVPDVLICSGACHSESYYSLEDGDFKSVCKCCKVNITVNRTVELRCPDGRLVGKTFLQPETCQCSKCAPESKKPWQKFQQQSQVEQEESESEVEQQPWNLGQFQQEENDYDFGD